MIEVNLEYIEQKIADGHYTAVTIDAKNPLLADHQRYELRMEFYLHLSTALKWNQHERELFIQMVEKDGNYQSVLNQALKYQKLLNLIKSC